MPHPARLRRGEGGERLAVCEARMSQALSLQAKFVKDFETVKDSAIPGGLNN